MRNIIELINKGLELAKEEKHIEAVKLLKSIIETDINEEIKKTALFQISICLMRLEKYVEAEEYLLKCLALGEDIEIYYMQTVLFALKKDNEKLLEAYEKILEINPMDSEAMIKVITLKKDRKEEDYLKAIKYMDYLIESKKIDALSYECKAVLFYEMYDVAKILFNVDKAMYYFDCYAASLSEEEKKKNDCYKGMLSAAFSLTLYSDYHSDEKKIAMMHEMYHLYKPEHVNTFIRDTSCFSEIKIGFLSSDLWYHPVGRFLLSLFRDKITNSGIKYFCYYTDAEHRIDAVTNELIKCSDKFEDIGDMKDDEAERIILEDKLDILFDMNGVSNGNKRDLVVKRLAPVQLTWIGFPCSSAIQNVDYTIVDYVTDPIPYSERFYTEKLAYMSKTFLCYPLLHDYSLDSLKIKKPPFIKNGFITFASFNNAYKFTDKMINAWAEILKRVPNSRLLISSMNGTKNEISMTALKRKFLNNGMDIAKVDFVKDKMFDEYLSSYNEADIILDTFPFNGATTTCDAFTMGVPVVSLYGTKHVERVGLSMLKNVNLDDLAVGTYEEYIEKAVELANDVKRLTIIRETLRDTLKNSPLSDTSAFKVEFENLLRKLHIKYCMDNKKKQYNGRKSINELVSEIMRGFYFIENLIYDEQEYDVVNYVRNDLYILQKTLFKILTEHIASNNDESELLDKYKKSVDLLFQKLDINEFKQINLINTKLLKKILKLY